MMKIFASLKQKCIILILLEMEEKQLCDLTFWFDPVIHGHDW